MRMKIRLHESVRYGEMVTLLRGKGYVIDDRPEYADEDKVVAYKEFSTGLSVNSPQKVTVFAKFYTDGSELAMEVLGGPYKDAVQADGFPKDLYSTFIIGESVCANKLLAEEHVEAAERAAKLYIKALDEIHGG